ncbi:TIGR00341 family protein [Haloglomus salinum]|uniref:TIGR00341 family protein n=1 Tax=Haloglomus salinum TaxID=2962673 RepID=UPI0020C9A1D9|nr:TIGR00341 family protein [Haloglomus salinum]
MRLVHASLPPGTYGKVVALLEEEGIDYTVTEETSDRYTHVVTFPLPTNAVEPVLTSLAEVGVDEDAVTVVTEAQAVSSRQFEELEARFAEEEASEDRIAQVELRETAESLASTPSTYVTLTVVSAVVATAGLLLDSPATVVGSMVIAPLIGPAMAAAVGTVIDDGDLFRRGVKFQALGVVLSVLAATAFAFLVESTNLVQVTDPRAIEQVRERLAPDFLSLAVALGAGTAGAVSLTTGVSTALVGVMIAVALIPPAATVGIGIAYGLETVALSAGVLTLVNLLSIELAALVVLYYAGYTPEGFLRAKGARMATVKRVGALFVGIAVLSVFLGGVTYDSYQQSQTEDAIEAAIDDALAADYGSVDRLDTTVEYEQRLLVMQRPTGVVVTVGVPPDGETAGLVSTLDARIDEAVGHDVRVEVRFVTVEHAERLAPTARGVGTPGATTLAVAAPAPTTDAQRAV